MTVQYDYKMRGLIVEVTEEELQAVAARVCVEGDREDLLENEIQHVTYRGAIPEEEAKRTVIGWLIGIFLLWAGTLIVMLAGLYQIGRWIIDWVY